MITASVRRLVVKAGSALVAGGGKAERARDFRGRLADDVARLRAGGTEVILVSSGAVALGRPPLGLGSSDRLSLDEKQAAAAAGQLEAAA